MELPAPTEAELRIRVRQQAAVAIRRHASATADHDQSLHDGSVAEPPGNEHARVLELLWGGGRR